MTGPDDPQYPDQPYPDQPYPAPPPQPAYPPGAYPPPPAQGYPPYPPAEPQRRPGLVAALGERATRRPQPRLGVSLAGAGIGLIIVGIIVWGSDYASGGTGGLGNGGGSHRFLGALLALLVVVAGYLLAIRSVRGPRASAGVVAGSLGIPVVLAFLTLGEAGDGFPFSVDAVVIVSVLAWVISYLAVPGARGHAFLLTIAAVLAWVWVLDKVEPKVFGVAFFLPTISIDGSDAFTAPDLSTVGSVSLAIGLGFYLLAFVLDRGGRFGTATAFVVAAVPAVDVGVAVLSRDLEEVGTGVLVIAIGLTVGAYAARYGRRFTTWVSTSGAAFGAVLIVVKIADDNATAGGIGLIIVGAAVVAVSSTVATALREPDDMATGQPPARAA